jgi:hypothetical protein
MICKIDLTYFSLHALRNVRFRNIWHLVPCNNSTWLLYVDPTPNRYRSEQWVVRIEITECKKTSGVKLVGFRFLWVKYYDSPTPGNLNSINCLFGDTYEEYEQQFELYSYVSSAYVIGMHEGLRYEILR